jgi:hypothetical protein
MTCIVIHKKSKLTSLVTADLNLLAVLIVTVFSGDTVPQSFKHSHNSGDRRGKILLSFAPTPIRCRFSQIAATNSRISVHSCGKSPTAPSTFSCLTSQGNYNHLYFLYDYSAISVHLLWIYYLKKRNDLLRVFLKDVSPPTERFASIGFHS